MPIFAIITMQPPARTACRLTRALLRTETLPQRFTAAPEEGRWVFSLFGKGWEWPIFRLQGAPAYFIDTHSKLGRRCFANISSSYHMFCTPTVITMFRLKFLPAFNEINVNVTTIRSASLKRFLFWNNFSVSAITLCEIFLSSVTSHV
jgi:hypothetical protein